LLQRPLLVEEKEGKVAVEVVAGCIRVVEVDRQSLALGETLTEVGKEAVEDIQNCSLDTVGVAVCRSF